MCRSNLFGDAEIARPATEAEKLSARHKVEKALKSGKLVKPLECRNCGSKRKLVAHHDDYGQPLEVKWYCYRCHWYRHNYW